MELEVLPQKLTVCKFASGDDTPLRAMLQAAAPFEGDFFFLAKIIQYSIEKQDQ